MFSVVALLSMMPQVLGAKLPSPLCDPSESWVVVKVQSHGLGTGSTGCFSWSSGGWENHPPNAVHVPGL